MPKVFIVNDSGYDFSKASRFGELVPLTKGHVPFTNGLTSFPAITEGLKDFNPSKDSLLLIGSPFLNAAAVLQVAGKTDFIKTLMFDAKQQDYSVRYLKTN